MKRVAASLVMVLAVWGLACQKSPEPPRPAERAINGQMPSGMPGVERLYVEDQAAVRLIAARKVSYDALDDFRAKNREKAGSKAESAGEEAGAQDSAEEAKGGEGSDADEMAASAPKDTGGKKPASDAKSSKPAEKPATGIADEKKTAKSGDKPAAEPEAKPVGGIGAAKVGKKKAEEKKAEEGDEDWAGEDEDKDNSDEGAKKPSKKPSGG